MLATERYITLGKTPKPDGPARPKAERATRSVQFDAFLASVEKGCFTDASQEV